VIQTRTTTNHNGRKNNMKQWIIDTAHSEISFKVKHLVVSTVTGRFDRFHATIEAGSDDFSDARITFEADVDSVNTKNGQRDTHLKSPDFFDAAGHPRLTFISSSVKKLSGHELRVRGDLTLRGVTRPVELDVIYNGTVAGFGGGRVAGFEVRGTIRRFDFGLRWNALTETGGVVVGNEVTIEILAEFTQAVEEARAA
jgi:polyisoprenoid-binding protein YceI